MSRRQCIQQCRKYSSTGSVSLKSPETFTSIYFPPARAPIRTSHATTSADPFFSKRSRMLYSASELKNHPYNVLTPEIVLLGSSNVGKSSFLNALVGVPNTAHVGPRPGKTTLMNAYGIGPDPIIAKNLISPGTPPPRHSLIVMDTPGYGFKSQAAWGETIVQYLSARKALKGAVLLLSSEKKRVLKEDRLVLRKLAETNTRTLTVLTKADKMGAEWAAQCAEFAAVVQEELTGIAREVNREWTEGEGWVADVFVTAAGMKSAKGAGAGMGGVRAAILDMAGIEVEEKVPDPDAKPASENKEYTGKIVSFDDIQWKS